MTNYINNYVLALLFPQSRLHDHEHQQESKRNHNLWCGFIFTSFLFSIFFWAPRLNFFALFSFFIFRLHYTACFQTKQKTPASFTLLITSTSTLSTKGKADDIYLRKCFLGSPNRIYTLICLMLAKEKQQLEKKQKKKKK